MTQPQSFKVCPQCQKSVDVTVNVCPHCRQPITTEYDFGRRIKELEEAIRSGAINPEPLDEDAEDDELGEPD